MLVVGDLMQLNPVGEKPVYKSHTTIYAALVSSPWELFSLYELKQIEDPRFANILSRIRLGEHTTEDVTL